MRLSPLVLVSLVLASGSALAQNGRAPWERYGDRVDASREVTALGDDLLGDSIALQNGALSFAATDVSLPGHGPAVSLGRGYQIRDWRYRKTDGMFGDWDAQVPQISGVYLEDWVDSSGGVARCTVGGEPAQNASSGVHSWDFWQGLSISIPGVTGGELLATVSGAPVPTGAGFSKYLTNDHVRIGCLTSIRNGTGEGFVAITPDGTKYWFDWMAQHHEPELRRGTTTIPGIMPKVPTQYTIQSRRNVLYATKVQDRFGNVVTYTYTNDWDDPGKLVKINTGDASGVGGDGRQITLTWTGNKVTAVSDGTRSWTYTYATTAGNRTTLIGVDTPGEGAWAIDFELFTDAEILTRETHLDEEYRRCQQNEIPQNYGNAPVGTITHPSGAMGTFATAIIEHRRSNVPLNCNNVTTQTGSPLGTGNNTNDDSAIWPLEYDAYTVTSKSISGATMPTATWTYSYESDRSFVLKGTGSSNNYPVCTLAFPSCMAPTCTSDSCAGSARTLVVAPNGSWTRFFHGNSYRYNEGKLTKVETGPGTAPAFDVNGLVTNALRVTTYTYDLSTANNAQYWARWGTGLRGNGDSFANEYHFPQTKRVITQQGVTFNWQATAFNRFAMPTVVTRYSQIAGVDLFRRNDTTVYLDNASTDAAWVLGLVQSETNTNVGAGVVTAHTDYDPTSLLPVTEYWPHAPGGTAVPRQWLTWHGNGQLATLRDGEAAVTELTTLGDWYRGVPRAVTYPDGESHAAQVNALGQITRITDQLGFETNYTYDARGLLASVAYPTGDTVGWNTTTLDFVRTTATEYGLPANTWRRTVSTGNGRKVTWYDAMWRPVLSREYDTANPTGTQRFNGWTYDAAGRQTFAPYPLASVTSRASFTTGTYTDYDALDRPIKLRQDSEYNVPGQPDDDRLATSMEYLSGFQTRVTNPRDSKDPGTPFPTTTSFYVLDEPDTGMPQKIEAPTGIVTTISRDALGRTTNVHRAGFWGATALAADRDYRYDIRGQLERRWSPEERATYFDYDKAGNLVASYQCDANSDATCGWSAGGSRPADVTSRTYDAMNRLTLVNYPGSTTDVSTTYTDDGLVATVTAGTVVQTYTYNRRRLLTREALTGLPGVNWVTDYGYDANGFRSSMRFPTAYTVAYTPNALGQPTQVGTVDCTRSGGHQPKLTLVVARTGSG